jgi:hypothetical protein
MSFQKLLLLAGAILTFKPSHGSECIDRWALAGLSPSSEMTTTPWSPSNGDDWGKIIAHARLLSPEAQHEPQPVAKVSKPTANPVPKRGSKKSTHQKSTDPSDEEILLIAEEKVRKAEENLKRQFTALSELNPQVTICNGLIVVTLSLEGIQKSFTVGDKKNRDSAKLAHALQRYFEGKTTKDDQLFFRADCDRHGWDNQILKAVLDAANLAVHQLYAVTNDSLSSAELTDDQEQGLAQALLDARLRGANVDKYIASVFRRKWPQPLTVLAIYAQSILHEKKFSELRTVISAIDDTLKRSDFTHEQKEPYRRTKDQFLAALLEDKTLPPVQAIAFVDSILERKEQYITEIALEALNKALLLTEEGSKDNAFYTDLICMLSNVQRKSKS